MSPLIQKRHLQSASLFTIGPPQTLLHFLHLAQDSQQASNLFNIFICSALKVGCVAVRQRTCVNMQTSGSIGLEGGLTNVSFLELHWWLGEHIVNTRTLQLRVAAILSNGVKHMRLLCFPNCWASICCSTDLNNYSRPWRQRQGQIGLQLMAA